MELPNSIEEVINLIQRFYNRQPAVEEPETHSRADKVLTELQRSQQGLRIADELLQHDDEAVRFFGASTFLAKIDDGALSSFTDDEKGELLNRILSWLITACDKDFTRSVIGKLNSCLVSYFFREEDWKHCLLHILASLVKGAPHISEPPSDLSLLKEAVQKLGRRRRFALYDFLDIFSQEVFSRAGAGPSPTNTANTRERILINFPVFAILVEYITDNLATLDDDDCVWAATRGFKYLAEWADQELGDPEVAWDQLRPALNSFIHAVIENADFTEMVSDALAEIMQECPKLLLRQHHEALQNVLLSPKANKWLTLLGEGITDTTEPESIARLLLVYCTVRVEKLVTNEQQGRPLFESALALTSFRGVAIVEDCTIDDVMEFWQNLTESLSMAQFASDGALNSQTWLQWYGGLLPKMAHAVIEKARLPSTEQMKEWSDTQQSKFSDFRNDVSALMGSLCELLGAPLVEHIVAFVWESKLHRDWNGIESGLNCLNYLVEYVDTDEDEDRVIPALLGSGTSDDPPLIALVSDEDVPLSVIKRVISFIDTHRSPLSRQSDQLPRVLNFLSRCLQISTSLAALAAKAISNLCIVGRVKMTSILHSLLSLYETYAASQIKREYVVQERLAGALSAVIQAATASAGDAEEWKRSDAVAILSRLLDTIENDIQKAIHFLDQGALDQAREMNLCALNCLRSMGKAFREPAEAVVDLDDDEETPPPTNIWSHTPELVQTVQQRILNICSVSLSRFSGPDEIEGFCHVLRAGYTESQPGPFVFPISATEEFVKQCSLSTPRLGCILDTVAVLLNKHKRRTIEVKPFALNCLKHVRRMIQPFFHVNPSEDPEIASIVTDFLLVYIPRYTDCLLNGDELEDLRHTFNFLVACLGSHEIMPKRSASKFWAAFIRDNGVQSGSQTLVGACLSEYSQSLCQILVREIGGGASRSELDELSEPIRALAFHGAIFQRHFKGALGLLQVPNNRVSPREKEILGEQIFKLRGSAKTTKTVKDFWAACRGTFTI